MADIIYTDEIGKQRKFTVKRDRDQPHKIFYAGPPYASITPDIALALANALADVIQGKDQ